ncbi:hypothetical protein ACHQM5_028254 [Ranunculus cassubicifolius]
MERLVLLPFSIGCTSQSSVAVIENNQKFTKPEQFPSPTSDSGKDESVSNAKMKFLGIRKPNMSSGIQKIVKTFKSLSEFFVFKDEVEELDIDMEIGHPTDVKHVTHFGLDGSTTFNPLVGLDELKQFELAMPSHTQ